MITIPWRTLVQRVSVLIAVTAYVFGIVMFALIAHDQFEDRRRLETGPTVESTILTVRPRKNQTSGEIAYRLPSGKVCQDWTELAPNGAVHPGETLAVAVGTSCGQAVSTKKRLTPWIFVILCGGGSLHLLYVLWKTWKRLWRPSHVA